MATISTFLNNWESSENKNSKLEREERTQNNIAEAENFDNSNSNKENIEDKGQQIVDNKENIEDDEQKIEDKEQKILDNEQKIEDKGQNIENNEQKIEDQKLRETKIINNKVESSQNEIAVLKMALKWLNLDDQVILQITEKKKKNTVNQVRKFNQYNINKKFFSTSFNLNVLETLSSKNAFSHLQKITSTKPKQLPCYTCNKNIDFEKINSCEKCFEFIDNNCFGEEKLKTTKMQYCKSCYLKN